MTCGEGGQPEASGAFPHGEPSRCLIVMLGAGPAPTTFRRQDRKVVDGGPSATTTKRRPYNLTRTPTIPLGPGVWNPFTGSNRDENTFHAFT